MKGVVELAEEVFHMPVRIGVPRDIGGLKGEAENPMHSTGVGLLLYGAMQQVYGENRSFNHVTSETVWERMKNWFNGNL